MAEKEYIEREAVLHELLYAMCGTGYQSRAMDAVHFVPAANVVEVEWKPVVGYEDDYEVSTTGQVRNKHGIILRPGIKKGSATCYKTVSLSRNGVQTTKSIHRLVAQAFIPNPDNLPMVNHKDEDGTNNFVGNLEWCTREYNTNYGTAKERRAERIRGVPHTKEHNKKIANKLKAYFQTNKSAAKGRRLENGKAVILMDIDGFEIRFATIHDAALYVKGNYRNISACCNGKRKTAYGFTWKWDGERKEATP
jgi:hypothetical protein